MCTRAPLIAHWITYAETPLFAGGCFWAANLADFDSRPGPVRDALYLTAFQIDAVLSAANTALRLGDHQAVTWVGRILDGILGAAG
jgi:hypothetical protein